MTWRAAANRARKARKELPAVARPSEGPAELQPGVSSLNSAGVSSQVAPAAFSEGPKRGRVSHVISKEDLAPLVARGLNDAQIGKLYGHSQSWVLQLRRIYGISPACGPGGYPRGVPRPVKPPPPPKIVAPPEPPPAPKPTREEMHEARYAAFFAAAGAYPSYTDRQISNYERVYDLTRARRRIVDMTPALHGDPAPDRPRA